MNWIEVEARLPRRVAQEFEVPAGRSELGRGRDGGGHSVSEKKKEGLARVLRVQTLSQHGTIHGSGRRMGGTGTMAYPHRRRPIHHGLPTRTITGTCGTAVFECCMLTMRAEDVVGSRELATPAVCGISTSTKSGLSWLW